jgi:ABC-type Mn2+/Zn2+ transport system ATPase subunit
MVVGDELLSLQAAQVVLGGRVVLSDISCAVHTNDTIHVRGDNGAGKTTLLLALAGLLPLARGQRRVRGEVNHHIVPSVVQVAFQEANALPGHLSVRDVMREPLHASWAAVPSNIADDGAALLHAFGVPTHMLDASVRSLSGGERQRVVVARACMLQPQVMLLDEPLRGADVLTARVLVEQVRALPWLQASLWVHHGEAKWLQPTSTWHLSDGKLVQPPASAT